MKGEPIRVEEKGKEKKIGKSSRFAIDLARANSSLYESLNEVYGGRTTNA